MSGQTHEWRARIIRELRLIWDESEPPEDQEDAIEAVIEQTCRDLCAIAGHEPERDHCGMPEHDHCAWCQTLMPGQAPR